MFTRSMTNNQVMKSPMTVICCQHFWIGSPPTKSGQRKAANLSWPNTSRSTIKYPRSPSPKPHAEIETERKL